MAPAVSSFLSGANPLENPLSLLIIQVIVIVSFSRLIAIGLKFLKQPLVIAEVIGGILLGKSALGRIPGFSQTLFPESSLNGLSLIANVGLVFYLFLVGLELDAVGMFSSFKKSAFISLSGVLIPFGLGLGTSVLLYQNLMPQPSDVPFVSFLIFIGVATSITAFPVLARILTERNLLGTVVGQAAISSAAVDDILAWILLLIVVAMINNTGNYIVALYAFLCIVGWGLFLIFLVRPLFHKFIAAAEKNETISEFTLVVTFLLVLISAWFTEAVGVHAIFGAFLIGLITPHDNGFAIKVAEKIEDFVCSLLLPLYFAYSGINTRIDQLNSAISWAMVGLVMLTVMTGKIGGCFLASKISGYSNRESLSIGVLMNTKGLVELIVLNIGLKAGVINVEVFTVMVVMALLTTFMTVPVISLIYPQKYHRENFVQKHSEEGTSSITESGKVQVQDLNSLPNFFEKEDQKVKALFPIIVSKDTNFIISIFQLISSMLSVEATALRLIDIETRPSAIMKMQGAESIEKDHSLNLFKFAAKFSLSTLEMMLHITGKENFVHHIIETSARNNSNIVVLSHGLDTDEVSFGTQTKFFNDLFLHSRCTTAVLLYNKIEENNEAYEASLNTVRSVNSVIMKSSSIQIASVLYVLFNGGTHSREALRFALLCSLKEGSTLRILVCKENGMESSSKIIEIEKQDTIQNDLNLLQGDEKIKDRELLENFKALNKKNFEIQELEVFKFEEISKIKKFKKSDLIIVGKDYFLQNQFSTNKLSTTPFPSSMVVVNHAM
ncbi:K(+)/H(+) antiporter [Lobulomyces angularis]|nr:K(+)/H(+) antiporter [Lobulomyces angularis]